MRNFPGRAVLSIALVLTFVSHCLGQVKIEVIPSVPLSGVYRVPADKGANVVSTKVTVKITGAPALYDKVSFQSDAFDAITASNLNGPHELTITSEQNYDKPLGITATLIASDEIVKSAAPPRGSSNIITASIDDDQFLPPVIEADSEEEGVIRQVADNDTSTGVTPKSIPVSFTIYVDSKPPVPLQPVVERFPGGSARLRVGFADFDTDTSKITKDNFRLLEEYKSTEDSTLRYSLVPIRAVEPAADRMSVTIDVPQLNTGKFYLLMRDISDVVGNNTGTAALANGPDRTNVQFEFTVAGGPQQGEQVPYPRFLVEGNKPTDFSPGDRVDTRVVQLYYMRDARQVAEIINRNIQDLNQHSYEEDQQFAADARAAAAKKIDARRYQETLAVEDAQATRAKEREYQTAMEELQKVQAAQDDLEVEEAKHKAVLKQYGIADDDALAAAIGDSRNAVVKAQAALSAATSADAKPLREALTNEQNKLRTLNILQANRIRLDNQEDQLKEQGDVLKARVAALPTEILNKQSQEITSRNSVLTAETEELRAAQEQFRREVIAGMADRNSYAKGNLDSIDPVTQTTISVVGTSRLQLRGPIKGVNKICRMIHQLDSPVGQVKLGIHTIQVNGEHGDRMDFVYERINEEIAHSRMLTNMSGQMFRKAVQEVASQVALQADQGILPDGCPPELTDGAVVMLQGDSQLGGNIQTTADQRDRRYLYAFFGSDFIGELEEMDSELLNTENKLISLHSMDTISLAGAMFVTAHADNPVRTRIMQRFEELISSELPLREAEYVRALTRVTHHGKSLQNRFSKAIRLDKQHDKEIYFNADRTYHFPNTVSFFNEQVPGQGTLNAVQYSTIKLAQALKAQLTAEIEYQNLVLERSLLESRKNEVEENLQAEYDKTEKKTLQLLREQQDLAALVDPFIERICDEMETFASTEGEFRDALLESAQSLRKFDRHLLLKTMDIQVKHTLNKRSNLDTLSKACLSEAFADIIRETAKALPTSGLGDTSSAAGKALAEVFPSFDNLNQYMLRFAAMSREVSLVAKELGEAQGRLEAARKLAFSKRLLEQFMDDQEEKSVDLMEALRSHSSNVDNYLKRLAIAVEDDVAAQFYEPAFQRIRRVSRTWDVTLGQIETTTVLTNNRTLAKVSPSASFEFDLPQRDILLTEALQGSKALATEYGNLLKDGTFLAGASMLSTPPATGVVGDNAPIQAIPGLQPNHQFGADLQKLIPDPSIYKFETGTGFEIRPIIQPDGHSIVYGFDYMYSTNVREPVRADEKHLGRIKRHFVHTDVQTSSYELREISRYTVALKASRTGRGVPLLEDIPVAGAAFRPLPSEESSLQTNIILGSSTIYPTVYDLMGLRWSQHVDQLGTRKLADLKDEQSNRRANLRHHLLDTTKSQVDTAIGMPIEQRPPRALIPSMR